MGSYFVKIDEAPELRRKLLESSKASLHVLKGYQQLLIIRSQKLSEMNHLRQELKQLNLLVNRAEQLMPLLTERELAELQPKPVPQKISPVQPKKENRVFVAAPKRTTEVKVNIPLPNLDEPKVESKPVKMTELEKLEAALSGIESKLGNL